jgi:hypothetical protein
MERRKELIRAYKETPRPMGIYQIKNLKNGKVLIGGSLDLPGKFNSHRFQLACGSHVNAALQADWQEYGQDAFVFEVLEQLNPDKVCQEDWRKVLAELEEKWLAATEPYGEKGYNKEKKYANV